MSGWTMKDAATSLGVSDSTVRRWVRDWQEFVEEWQEEGATKLSDASIEVLREIKRLRDSQTPKEEIREQLQKRFTSVVTLDEQTQQVQTRPVQNDTNIAIYDLVQSQVTSVNRLADSMDDFSRRLDSMQNQQEMIHNLQARIAMLEEEVERSRGVSSFFERIRSLFHKTRILPECAKVKKKKE